MEEAKRTFLEMLDAAARHKVQKVLLDGRGIAGEPEIMERFYYGEFVSLSVATFEAHGVSRATQFAYVLEEPVLDPRRFGENVAVNRGMFVRTFDNLEDALGWLETAAANQPDAGDGK